MCWHKDTILSVDPRKAFLTGCNEAAPAFQTRSSEQSSASHSTVLIITGIGDWGVAVVISVCGISNILN
jgi:hypothetical protein